VATLLTHVVNAQPLSLVEFHANRLHEGTTFAFAIPRDILIHVQRPETDMAMIATAAIGVRRNLLPAFFAGEAFVDGDGIFSKVHI